MNDRFQEISKEIAYVLYPSKLRLTRSLQSRLEDEDFDLSTEELRAYLVEGSDAHVQPLLTFVIAAVDADRKVLRPDTETAPGSPERLDWVIGQLGLADVREELMARLPKEDPIVIVDEAFRHWYTPEREAEHTGYWDDYQRVLQRNGWNAESIATVDNQAREVLKRIEDPAADHYVSSRGLVVGYVQSGKTANFTAVAAKAIDAGYRLVIVLAGTLDNLRNQTQRRLDKELFGREAVLAGFDESTMTEKEMRMEAYFSGEDEEWNRSWAGGEASAFIEHGAALGSYGFPRMKRLTTSADDYRGKPGSNPLEIEIPNKSLPPHDPENLFNMPCMVAVVKKNAAVLRQFNSDLKRAQKVNGVIADLPTLVIDDESDQASINTKPNNSTDSEERERTAVNAEITELLMNCPRAQYIGYTATPFANVFVDPSDPEDLYPRHYVLMLNKPPAYRGAKWFHDRSQFSDHPELATIENSQSKAFIRDLAEEFVFDTEEQLDDVRTTELQEALDMFVLTGAIKMFRHAQNPDLKFKHHTMLVHEGVGTETHTDAKEKLEEMWRRRGYNLGRPNPTLKQLFENDLLPIMRLEQYSAGAPYPETYEELHPYVIKAYQEIMSNVQPGNFPILQVDTKGGDVPDFEAGRVWKVLVGGAKLSRGYTVEGLTISYFRRRTGGADTLMQTGRWFGFRKGYQDLVRLYAPPSLTEMFESAMHDEDAFRENIRVYEELDGSNKPRLTPMELAPLVQQSLTHLKPTSASKMFNAYIVKSACAPESVEFLVLPEPSQRKALADNFTNVALPLLQNIEAHRYELPWMEVKGRWSENPEVGVGTNGAFVGRIPSDVFIDLLDAMQWNDTVSYRQNVVNPRLKYLRDLIGRGEYADPQRSDFADVAIILPAPNRSVSASEVNTIHVPGIDFPVPLVQRKRREGRSDISRTPMGYRYIIENIAAGNFASFIDPADAAEYGLLTEPKISGLPEPTLLRDGNRSVRGAVLLTLFDDRDRAATKQSIKDGTYTPPQFDKGEVGVALSVSSPHAALKGRGRAIEWGVRIQKKDGETPITVDAVDMAGQAE